jgi:hypothetical protein
MSKDSRTTSSRIRRAGTLRKNRTTFSHTLSPGQGCRRERARAREKDLPRGEMSKNHACFGGSRGSPWRWMRSVWYRIPRSSR